MAERYRIKLKDRYLYEESKVTEKELVNLVDSIYNKLKKENKPKESSLGGTYYGSTQLMRHVSNRLDIVKWDVYKHTPSSYYDIPRSYDEAYYVIVGGAYDRDLYKNEINKLKNMLSTSNKTANYIRIGNYLYGLISDYGTSYSVYGFYRTSLTEEDEDINEWQKEDNKYEDFRKRLKAIKNEDELVDLLYEVRHSDIKESHIKNILFEAKSLQLLFANIEVGKIYKSKYSYVYPKYIKVVGIDSKNLYWVEAETWENDKSEIEKKSYPLEKLIEKLKRDYKIEY